MHPVVLRRPLHCEREDRQFFQVVGGEEDAAEEAGRGGQVQDGRGEEEWVSAGAQGPVGDGEDDGAAVI